MSNNYVETGKVGYPGTDWFDIDFDGGTNHWKSDTPFETVWWVRNVDIVADTFSVVFRSNHGVVISDWQNLNVQQGKWFEIRDRLSFPIGEHSVLVDVWTANLKRRYSFTVHAEPGNGNGHGQISELKITSYQRTV